MSDVTKVLHIGLCDGRHPIVQNDYLFRGANEVENPTAGEGMDLFVFPDEVDDPLAFDEFRETAHKFIGYYLHEMFMEKKSKVYLYVTGLSSLLTSFLWVWIHNDYLWNKVPLVLMHYDRDSGQYKEEYWG